MEFRLLKANEIDVRVATVTAKGISLLLYKDARVDMNVLDETVGAMNWKREHTRENANCIVSIWDENKKEWVSKEDTGTESYTEKEKGLASDSFKRACVNWGIGRELYTAPFIWIPIDKVKMGEKNGKATPLDSFKVTSIGYNEEREITKLTINGKKGCVFSFLECGENFEETPLQEMKQKLADVSLIDRIKDLVSVTNTQASKMCSYFKVKSINDLSEEQAKECIKILEGKLEK